jgi:MraZ protein
MVVNGKVRYIMGSSGRKWYKKRTMLIGEYTHSIDDKNRISLPAKFRKEVGKKVVLTHGLDNCLFLYSFSEWEKISEKLASLSMGQADTRGFNRFILAGATEVEIDGAGRILIPEYLKKFAQIDETVVFTGVHNRIELWNESRWVEYKKKIETEADKLAQKLGEVGAF